MFFLFAMAKEKLRERVWEVWGSRVLSYQRNELLMDSLFRLIRSIIFVSVNSMLTKIKEVKATPTVRASISSYTFLTSRLSRIKSPKMRSEISAPGPRNSSSVPCWK